ncbi:MAG: Mo-dependent nitrogenase C-terminal domain-containing protein [Cyanobacteria bacterium P01_D01_bin.123]
MTSASPAAYSDVQISAWLRGLLTVAWADGNYDPQEREAIAQLTQSELAPKTDLGDLEPISAAELAAALKSDRDAAENFMRTATIVAIADGVYSAPEAELLKEFCTALDLDIEALRALEATLYRPGAEAEAKSTTAVSPISPPDSSPAILQPVKSWMDGMDVNDPRVARFICKMVPSQCPFERDVKLFGRKIVHIPAMCKINPLYDQLVGLRFRALSYLADDCGEDVSSYC